MSYSVSTMDKSDIRWALLISFFKFFMMNERVLSQFHLVNNGEKNDLNQKYIEGLQKQIN